MSDAGRQRDAQWASELEDAVGAAVEERLKTVYTSEPGIIKAFDRTKLTATVQPVHEQIWIDDDGNPERVRLPLCTDVPVQFPGGGGTVLTFDVSDGDECILLFSQRCIDEWWQLGGTQAPGEHRFHDPSDGMAVVGLRSQPRAGAITGGVASGGAELRTLDGLVLVRVDGSGVTLGSKAGAVPTIALTTDVLTWFGKVALAGNGGGPAPGPFPSDFATTLVKVK